MLLLQATKHLADMAGQMPHLEAFVHVSTAYVNGNQPKGSLVPEQLIGLQHSQGQPVNHTALVDSLQCLPRAEASSKVCFYGVLLNGGVNSSACNKAMWAALAASGFHCVLLPTL